MVQVGGSPKALFDRGAVLQQKLALCSVGGGAHSLDVCDARRARLLQLASPVGAGACAACRAYTSDALALLRRGGAAYLPPDSADSRRALGLLHGLCEDLDMRHNATAGVPGSRLFEQCNTLVSEHFDGLATLVHVWPHADLTHHICARTLHVCEPDGADGGLRKLEL